MAEAAHDGCCAPCDRDGSMSKETDYRMSAAQTMQLAERASTLAEKGRLLLLAGRWLELADRAHRAAFLGT
jgi:hypothetical protein